MELVSVVMSIYKENIDYLKQSIDSIINQTYRDIEFIIVIDNPENQQAINLVEHYRTKDNRIVLVINMENIGLASSLNLAINQASGQYIVRMDADDISDIRRIELQYSFLNEHQEYDLVCSGAKRIDANGITIGTINYAPKNDQVLMDSIKYGSAIIHPSVMFKKSAFDRVGGYYKYLAAQDFDLWVRMKNAGSKFHYIAVPLLKYRISDNSTTKSKAIVQGVTAKYILDIYKRHKTFDEFAYRKYLEKKISNKRFQKQFMKYESVKKLFNFSDCFMLIYLFIVNDVCRCQIIKNLYFIFFLKKSNRET